MRNSRKEHQPPITKAVIYCRVSSKKQVTEGNGLSSQELRCRRKCEEMNLAVIGVFSDGGISGKYDSDKRPGLQKLFALVKASKERIAIVVNDGSRWSRNKDVYPLLKAQVRKLGSALIFVDKDYDDSPGSELEEHIMVGVAHFERRSNNDRVRSRTEAHLYNGNLPWARLPFGLKRMGKKATDPLVYVEGAEALIHTIFTGFVNGRLPTQQSILNFLKASPDYRKLREQPPTLTWVKKLLKNPNYAGFLEYKPWDIELTKANIPAAISFQVYAQAQDKLSQRPKHKQYQGWRADLPLRQHLLCELCKSPMTASWCAGNGGKYSYYYCKTTGCKPKPKMNRSDKMHAQFSGLLEKITPKPAVIEVLTALLTEGYTLKADEQKKNIEEIQKRLLAAKAHYDALNHNLVKEQDEGIRQWTREQILEQRRTIVLLEEELSSALTMPERSQTIQRALEFIKTPKKLWQNGDAVQKRLVLNLVFPNKITVKPGGQFKTNEFSMPFKLLSGDARALVENGGR